MVVRLLAARSVQRQRAQQLLKKNCTAHVIYPLNLSRARALSKQTIVANVHRLEALKPINNIAIQMLSGGRWNYIGRIARAAAPRSHVM